MVTDSMLPKHHPWKRARSPGHSNQESSYIELSNSFLIGQKCTVNFQSQHRDVTTADYLQVNALSK